MGFIRKITGAQGQINAVNANAAAQIEAAKTTASAQVKALNDSAYAAAEQQRIIAERSRAEDAAAQAAMQPMQVAEVSLADAQTGSVAAVRQRKRAQFGKNYSSTGVNI